MFHLLVSTPNSENFGALQVALAPLGIAVTRFEGSLQELEENISHECQLLIIDSAKETTEIFSLLNRLTADAERQLPVLWLAPGLTSVERRLHQDLLMGLCVLVKPCPVERITAAANVCVALDSAYREMRKALPAKAWPETQRQGLLGVGDDGRIRYANRAASRLLQLTPLQLSGLYLQSFMEPPTTVLVPRPIHEWLPVPWSGQQGQELPRCQLWRGDGRPLTCHAAMVPGAAGMAGLFAFRVLPAEQLFQDHQATGQYPALDMLTGLPSLASLELMLNGQLALGDQSALLVIDIDHLRHINESLGYAFGDQLLRMAAGRLQQAGASLATLFRIAGDRFVAVVNKVTDFREAGRFAQRLNAQFRQPFLLGGHEVYCGASIGVALYPGSGDTPESLLQAAEIALERSKLLGRNMVQFYSAEMNRHSLEQLIRETALHQVLSRGKLPLRYIPWLTSDGSVWGRLVELDWEPEDGSLAQVAAESGLRCALSRRLLEQALRDYVPADDNPLMLVFGAACLRDNRLVDRVAGLVDEKGAAHRICLIVEMDSGDWSSVATSLNRLHQVGVKLACAFGEQGISPSALQGASWNSLVLSQPLAWGTDRGQQLLAGLVAFAQALGLPLLVATQASAPVVEWLYQQGVGGCPAPVPGSLEPSAAL